MNRKVCLLSYVAWTLSLACSSESSAPADKLAKFLGTWTYTTGQITLTCGVTVPPLELTGKAFTLTKGTASDLLRTQEGCSVKIGVQGDVARAEPNQACTVVVQLGGMSMMADLVLADWTLTTKDGKTATTSGSGKVKGMFQGLAVECPVAETATMTKGVGDGGATSDTGAASADTGAAQDAGTETGSADAAGADGGSSG